MPGSLVTLTVDESPMQTYVAVPEGDGPFPGVAVAQHRLGIDVFMRNICDRLAEAGYVAAAPDIYHRGWSLEQFAEITAMPRGDERAEAVLPSLSAALTEPEVVRDMNATFTHLKEHPHASIQGAFSARVAVALRHSLRPTASRARSSRSPVRMTKTRRPQIWSASTRN